jgi:hypothetical protein
MSEQDGGFSKSVAGQVVAALISAAILGAIGWLYLQLAAPGQQSLAELTTAVLSSAKGLGVLFLCTSAASMVGWAIGRRGGKARSGAAAGTRFFRNRAAMLDAHLGLENELRACDSALAVFPAGHHVAALSEHAIRKIRRLILTDPNAPAAEVFAKQTGAKSE